MQGERYVGGLWCREVLENLCDYVDDELDDELRRTMESHLRGCDVCERFGGEYAATVGQLRTALSSSPPLAEELQERLRQRLRVAQLGDSDS